MADRIERVEAFAIRIPRDTPYLGGVEDGVRVTKGGYFVRPGNRAVYCTADQTVLVRVTTTEGAVGWGECFGVIGPHAVVRTIADVLGPLIVGRDPQDVVVIYEDLYDAMRVRGFYGGYYVDAVAGIDIALWDLKGHLTGLPVASLLGGIRKTRLPCYVSGLPGPSLAERANLAAEWVGRGFDAIKFAAAVAADGEEAEMCALRDAVGPNVRILCDMHWRNTAQEAIKAINRMDAYDLAVAEAPCASEDIEGQSQVCAAVAVPVAVGEELRTRHEYLPRFVRRCMSIVQPEVAHAGITEMMNIGRMAAAFHCRVMPHATTGLGLQQAAALHCAAALPDVPLLEYQHSVFDRNLPFLETDMRVGSGAFYLPQGAGLGAEPCPEVLEWVVEAGDATG